MQDLRGQVDHPSNAPAKQIYQFRLVGTIWPWYSYVAPVSWLVYNDTIQGRSRLNFSEWNSGSQRCIGEMTRVLQEGEMPPPVYLPMHPAARLTATEKQQLITDLGISLK